jgi:hypothetical protein
MKQDRQLPPDVKLIPVEPVPDRLFVCFARVKPQAGIALKNAYESGGELPRDLRSLHADHLRYTYDLGEKGSYWEAGPSADFTEILYIFSTASMEQARGLMRNDPFYKSGVFHDDWWFEWSVHTPAWKLTPPQRAGMEALMRDIGILPRYPQGIEPPVMEIKVEIVTPPKLIVALAKADVARIKQVEMDHKAGKPVPYFLMGHFANRLGPGGTAQMGYDWESGPSSDSLYDLTIMSVNSIQMGKQLRENDRFTIYGLFYDLRYFEWCVMMPYKKASPIFKDTLKTFLKESGVIPAG